MKFFFVGLVILGGMVVVVFRVVGGVVDCVVVFVVCGDLIVGVCVVCFGVGVVFFVFIIVVGFCFWFM